MPHASQRFRNTTILENELTIHLIRIVNTLRYKQPLLYKIHHVKSTALHER